MSNGYVNIRSRSESRPNKCNLSKKYKNFRRDRFARFLITNHFEDYVLGVLGELEKAEGVNYFIYTVYQHKEDYVCCCERRIFKEHQRFLTSQTLLGLV